jgi:hypothetical protein
MTHYLGTSIYVIQLINNAEEEDEGKWLDNPLSLTKLNTQTRGN